jgi:four helix bundle protein
LVRLKEKQEEREENMSGRKRHNYKNLKIWSLGIEIVNDVFEFLNKFPKDEKFGLKSQISRCSISIPCNVAEGSSRTDKSFFHFSDISLGSSFELETQLTNIEEKIQEFQKMTMGFQNKL